jgi:hypothetical protein
MSQVSLVGQVGRMGDRFAHTTDPTHTTNPTSEMQS